jgi:apoptosis-inducing factor 3
MWSWRRVLTRCEIKEVFVINDVPGEGPVITDGERKSFDGVCPHFGAPLNILNRGNSTFFCCDKHDQVFDSNGNPIRGPCVGSLRCTSKLPSTPSLKNTESLNIAIAGSGIAALSAATTLRREGFLGSIHIITKDKDAFYDRTMLSKSLNLDFHEIGLYDWQENPLNLILSTDTEISQVTYDSSSNQVTSISPHLNKTFTSDKCIIAIGSTPNILPPAATPNSSKIFYVRNKEEVELLWKEIKSSSPNRIKIIGSSFIAVELASLIHKINPKISVQMTSLEKYPMETVLGQIIGREAIYPLLAANSIKFNEKTSDGGDDSLITIVCIGVKSAKIQVDPEIVKTGKVVFAGDCAPGSTGHWNEAVESGRHSAIEILQDFKAEGKEGKNIDVKTLPKGAPFFWSSFFGSSMKFVGTSKNYKSFEFVGSLISRSFIGFYLDEVDKVIGVIGMGEMADTNFSMICHLMNEDSLDWKNIKENPIEKLHNMFNKTSSH